jgi:uncharacterized membrane protein
MYQCSPYYQSWYWKGTQKEFEQMRVGIWFYGLATIITGILDLVWGAFEASHQPIKAMGRHIPGEHVLAYIAGAWLVAAGLAILSRRNARMGAAGSAIIYLIFAFFWIPRFYVMTHMFGFGIGVVVFVLGGIGAQVLLAAPAAFVYAAIAPPGAWRERAATVGRWMLGVPPILLGLGHLINLHAYARFVPHWIPLANFWVVVTGMAFLLAGGAIVSGVRDVLAARLLALMLLVFEFAIEVRPVFAQPHSQQAWGGAVYNLTAIGACWIFAEFVANRRRANQNKISVTGHVAMAEADSIVA